MQNFFFVMINLLNPHYSHKKGWLALNIFLLTNVYLNMAQRFAYGLWRFRSGFLSTETKAGYRAKTLLVADHPP
jgi:hypothetical protein